MTPDRVIEGARDVRLVVRRSDSGPLCECRDRLWLGLALEGLVRIEAEPRPRRAPRTLVARIQALDELFAPPAEAGDRIRVAVYRGEVPITAPTELRVVALGGANPHEPTTEEVSP